MEQICLHPPQEFVMGPAMCAPWNGQISTKLSYFHYRGLIMEEQSWTYYANVSGHVKTKWRCLDKSFQSLEWRPWVGEHAVSGYVVGSSIGLQTTVPQRSPPRPAVRHHLARKWHSVSFIFIGIWLIFWLYSYLICKINFGFAMRKELQV